MKHGMGYDRAHARAKRHEDADRRRGRVTPPGDATMKKADAKIATLAVQRAADILQHPHVAAHHFALPASNVARVLRSVVGRLKDTRRKLSADEIEGVGHALHVAADYLRHPELTNHPRLADSEEVATSLDKLAKTLKTKRRRP